MTKRSVVALLAACAAISVAADWPALGPAWMPPRHVGVDLCSEPRTLAEAHDVLAQLVDPALLKQIQAQPEGFVRGLNSSLGMALRNMWGLWNGGALRDHLVGLGVDQADDMSELVLVTFRRHLKDEPLGVATEVARSQAKRGGASAQGPRCRCLPVGRCRSTFVVSPLPGVERGFELRDCCCLRVPQVVEGIVYMLPDAPAGMLVVPPASNFRDSACGAAFGRQVS